MVVAGFLISGIASACPNPVFNMNVCLQVTSGIQNVSGSVGGKLYAPDGHYVTLNSKPLVFCNNVAALSGDLANDNCAYKPGTVGLTQIFTWHPSSVSVVIESYNGLTTPKTKSCTPQPFGVKMLANGSQWNAVNSAGNMAPVKVNVTVDNVSQTITSCTLSQ